MPLDHRGFDVVLVRSGSYVAGRGQWQGWPVVPPKVAAAPVRDHEKEAIVIRGGVLLGDDEVQKRLRDQIVNVLFSDMVLVQEEPPRVADDLAGRQAVGIRPDGEAAAFGATAATTPADGAVWLSRRGGRV